MGGRCGSPAEGLGSVTEQLQAQETYVTHSLAWLWAWLNRVQGTGTRMKRQGRAGHNMCRAEQTGRTSEWAGQGRTRVMKREVVGQGQGRTKLTGGGRRAG